MKEMTRAFALLVLGVLLVCSLSITPTHATTSEGNQKPPTLRIVPVDDKRAEGDAVEESAAYGIHQSSMPSTPSPTQPLLNPTDTVTYNLKTGTETRISSPAPAPEVSGVRCVEPFEGLLASDPELCQSIYEDCPSYAGTESVIGADDRSRITATTSYPWRTICKLYIFHPGGGGVAVGSGWFTDSYHVVTAGHCVYLHQEEAWPYDAWASQIVVIPGMDDGYAPYTKAYATTLRSYTGWTVDMNHEHDWGMITLDREIGATTGWMGRMTADSSNAIYTDTVNSAGYPHDLDVGLNMYFDADAGDGATENNHWYFCDTAGGQSGMPIWRLEDSIRYVLTVHAYGIYGSYTTNHGTRLNSDKFDRIYTWQDADTPPTAAADLIDRGQRWCEEWEPWPANWGNRYGTFSPSLVGSGLTSFTVQCQVSNFGALSCGAFDVSFYASVNDYISTSDYLIGTARPAGVSAWGSTTATWTGTFPGGVPSGNYYIGWIIDTGSEVSEMDETNNRGVITSSLLQVDATAPSNPNSYASNPAVNVWTTDNTIYVSWSGASDGSGSGVYGYGLFWSHTPGLPSAVVDTTNTYTTSSALSDGIWYLNIRTRDNVGNWNSGYYSVGPFKVDRTAPTNPTGFTSNPSVNVWTADNTVYVEWSGASDGSGSGINGYGLFWSTTPTGTPSQTVDTSDTYTTSSTLASYDGWYLHIITRDNVGNWNMTVFHIGPFRIDTVAPTTGFTLTGTMGANNWYHSLVNVTLSPWDLGSGVASTMVNINGTGWQAYAGKFNVNIDGIYGIEWYSTDAAGNVEGINSITVKIDKAAPETNHTTSGTVVGSWFITDVSITLVAIDATSGIENTSYRVDGGAWQLYTGYFFVTSEGAHTIEYFSVDVAGNVESSHSFEVDIDKSGPTWDQTPTDQTVPFGGSFRYDLNASDALSGISQWTINDTTHFSIDSQGVITGVGSLPAGSYDLKVVVTDVAGHELVATFRVVQEPLPIIIPLGIGIIIGIIVVAAIALVLLRRRRKRER